VPTQLIGLYRHHQQRRGFTPRTVTRRCDVLHNLARFTDTPILDLTHLELLRWVDAKPIGPRTRYAYISAVSCFYEWAIREGLTDSNPTVRMERPKMRRTLPRPIAPGDLRMAIQLATPRLAAILTLAALQGLRCQEIAGLTRADVLETDAPPSLYVTQAKGGYERVVPLHPATVDALRRAGLPRVGPLFTTQYGRPYVPPAISRMGNCYLRSLGIDATMHQLRHRFATDFYRASGGDIRLTQEVLGHQSPTSTAIYTQVSTSAAARVIVLLPA
jgi:integrase/recombinase XerC